AKDAVVSSRPCRLGSDKKKGRLAAPFFFSESDYLLAVASLLLCRAAAFLWIKPLRAARSSSLTAACLSSGVPVDARLSAVRSADFWARLRTAAARDFRMFFFAEARLGTS